MKNHIVLFSQSSKLGAAHCLEQILFHFSNSFLLICAISQIVSNANV